MIPNYYLLPFHPPKRKHQNFIIRNVRQCNNPVEIRNGSGGCSFQHNSYSWKRPSGRIGNFTINTFLLRLLFFWYKSSISFFQNDLPVAYLIADIGLIAETV